MDWSEEGIRAYEQGMKGWQAEAEVGRKIKEELENKIKKTVKWEKKKVGGGWEVKDGGMRIVKIPREK